MLIKRIISSIFLTALLTATLLMSKTNIFIYLCVINVLVGIGMYEVLGMIERKGIPVFKVYVIAAGIVLLSSIFFSVYKKGLTGDVTAGCMFILFFVLFLLYAFRGNLSGALPGIFGSIGTVFYVSWFFSFLVRINYLEGVDGRLYVLYVFFMVFLADIFAYFIGNNLGRHPLAPIISPKKTIEGAVGAFIGALVGAVLGKMLFAKGLALNHAVIIGILVGLISQFGDLFESILKRDSGVKDSGNVLPGMGGVMDLIDGLLFCSPVVYLYLKIFVK